IRDFHVTGVQTCALPISTALLGSAVATAVWWPDEVSKPWLIEMVARLDGTCLAVLHATEVVRVAERYEALVDPDPERAPPTRPEIGRAACRGRGRAWGDA